MEQRSVYLLIIAVLALTAGYLGYQVSQQGDTIETQTGQIAEGNLEREALELDLQKLRFSYDTLQTENSLMMAEMSAQRSEIEGLIKKVRDRNYSVSKLKKETETLRRIMQGYVVTIDSLNQANIALQAERDAMAEQVSRSRSAMRICSVVRRTWRASSRPVGSCRRWTSMPMAIRVASTGSQRETTRAKRAEMIKTCFTLMENRIAEKGERTLFLEVLDPDGRLLPPGDRHRWPWRVGFRLRAARSSNTTASAWRPASSSRRRSRSWKGSTRCTWWTAANASPRRT